MYKVGGGGGCFVWKRRLLSLESFLVFREEVGVYLEDIVVSGLVIVGSGVFVVGSCWWVGVVGVLGFGLVYFFD